MMLTNLLFTFYETMFVLISTVISSLVYTKKVTLFCFLNGFISWLLLKMSDAWEEIQAIKSKRNSLREKLQKRKKERQDILNLSSGAGTKVIGCKGLINISFFLCLYISWFQKQLKLMEMHLLQFQKQVN